MCGSNSLKEDQAAENMLVEEDMDDLPGGKYTPVEDREPGNTE